MLRNVARSKAVALATASTLLISATGSATGNATADDLQRAERIRSFDDRTLGGTVYAHWLPDGVRFTYFSRAASDGTGSVFLVDPATGSKEPLFAAIALAQALSKASGTTVDPEQLPAWRLVGDGRQLSAMVAGQPFLCTLPALACKADPGGVAASGLVPDWATRSPDGKWDAFVWNYNLYIRPAGAPLAGEAGTPFLGDGDGNAHFGANYGYYFFQPSRQRAGCDNPAPQGPVNSSPPAFQPPPPGSIAITTDGERLYSYGPRWKGGTEVATLDSDRYRPTKSSIVWSPDSSRLVIRREDIRGVGIYPLYSSTANQPVDHSYYYAAPGAEHIPQYDLYVADIAKRAARKVDVPSNSIYTTADGERWSADGRHLLAANTTRDYKTVTLYDVDPETGAAKPLIREKSETYVRMSSRGNATNIAVDDKSGDIFWFSERDGWGHLYRYGRDGTLKNQLDKGDTVFSEIIHVDGDARQIYFTAWGGEAANLYYRHLYRIGFDGTGLKALTPEPGTHDIRWFPKGGYFLDTYQSVDRPPVTVVRRADGTVVQTVSRGTDAPLRAIGWRPAEPFTVKARDGQTDLFGILYKPHDFDPAKRYPVVVVIYPGPQMGSVYSWRFQGGDNFGPHEDESRPVTHDEGMSQSLAELGFIVVRVNSLGTAERSKAFEDFIYGNAIDNGLPDQIAALRQLAQRHAWLDLDRVGIVGHSGGGFAAAAAMLTHPEFFKVGVAESGNHDFRTYGWYWGEMYQGPLKTSADAALYARQANLTYADKLTGKLMLVHGDMDCNNPPAQTLRLADALIQHDKPFDLLIVPESGHQLPPYVMRRVWNYFLTNLKGEAGPKD